MDRRAVNGPVRPAVSKGAAMNIPQSVASILKDHITLEVESIDRMYLNAYVPRLQYAGGVVQFFREHRGQPIASSALMSPLTRDFVAAIERFVKTHSLPLITFEKGQDKDKIAAPYRSRFTPSEGVVFVGKAQEKASVFRTEKRRNPDTGRCYPWIVRSTALVNQYYFYCQDRNFGPFFLKFCSYFPYNAKLCLNGHEYAKAQLRQAGIGFEALDNGFVSCEHPHRLQALCDGLSAEKIDALLRHWLNFLPHPFSQADQQAGYTYDLSLLQAEFSLTQILDRPLSGRLLFEQVIRENLDLGRPDRVQLIFNRRVTKSTPGTFRTRVITEGVTPSLHVYYKSSKIKQYHKEVPGQPLTGARAETTINNPRDFSIGKRLCNLSKLRQVGFPANRRLLEVERLSHDPSLGEAAFQQIHQPREVNGQRVPALRSTDPRVLVLWSALVMFRLLPSGFASRDFRQHLASLSGQPPQSLTPGRMTYDLRRLRLHGMIQRIPGTHRYQVTETGLRVALFFTRVHARLFRPALSELMPHFPPVDSKLRQAFEKLEGEIYHRLEQEKLSA
jgi:hypothetical protein